jgi:hypothetical protein
MHFVGWRADTFVMPMTGDVVKAVYPMRIRAETVQDSRTEFQGLKVSKDCYALVSLPGLHAV